MLRELTFWIFCATATPTKILRATSPALALTRCASSVLRQPRNRRKDDVEDRRHPAQKKKENMRAWVMLTVFVAALVVQGAAIQVECRQCYIQRQNEEYFEQAKKILNKRHDCTYVVNDESLTSSGMNSGEVVEPAKSTGKLVATYVCVMLME